MLVVSNMKEDRAQTTIHVRVTGKPAMWLAEMKAEGFVSTNTDAVIQGLIMLYKQYRQIETRNDAP